ncbi:hypothetical protein ACU3L3_06905 [Priestia endophytica]
MKKEMIKIEENKMYFNTYRDEEVVAYIEEKLSDGTATQEQSTWYESCTEGGEILEGGRNNTYRKIKKEMAKLSY